MSILSRSLTRWHPLRVAAAASTLSVLLWLAAYAVGAATGQVTLAGLAAAAALAGIAATGLLYAWRPGAGGIVD